MWNKSTIVRGLAYSITIILGVGFLDCQEKPPTSEQLLTWDHDRDITSDETWTADKVHIISRDISIIHATLTIEPNTVIKLAKKVSLKVMEGGGLIADGTDGEITLTGIKSQKGYWSYILFAESSLDSNCKLINCRIEYGGGDNARPALIYCDRASPTITNSKIQNSKTNGLILIGDSAPQSFIDNVVTANDDAPVQTYAAGVPALGTGQYTGNGNDYIRVNEGTIQTDGRWKNLGVPYRIVADLNISKATLTLEEGVTLEMAAHVAVNIGDEGGLMANSTSIPVTFTGAVPQKGYWDGINFGKYSNDVYCQLRRSIIEYGGGDDLYPANIYCDNASPTITECIVRNSQKYGLYLVGDSAPQQFINNTITLNDGPPISIFARSVSALGYGYYWNNVQDYIEVRDGLITRDSNWKNLGLAYRLVNNVTISNAKVFIDPGTLIEFGNHVSLNVMDGGGLIADGTSQQIVFTGAERIPGYWDCIYFGDNSLDFNCRLNNCLIEYGGGSYLRPANIYCDNASPTISNCRIENSQQWGIYLFGDSQPDLTDNIFAGNGAGDIWPLLSN